MLNHEKITLRSHLGFIGLGYLGSRIAKRLVTAGFPDGGVRCRSRESGGTRRPRRQSCAVPWRAGQRGDIVLSCLPDESVVQTVYLGAGSVLDSARPGARIVEMSTISLGGFPASYIGRRRKLMFSALTWRSLASTNAAEAGASDVIRRWRPRSLSKRPRLFFRCRETVVLHGAQRLRCCHEVGGERALGSRHAGYRRSGCFRLAAGPASRPALGNAGEDRRSSPGPSRKIGLRRKGATTLPNSRFA